VTKIAGSASGSESISQRHGPADPDPDPHQNVMDSCLTPGMCRKTSLKIAEYAQHITTLS
jgi:hypothetical protein